MVCSPVSPGTSHPLSSSLALGKVSKFCIHEKGCLSPTPGKRSPTAQSPSTWHIGQSSCLQRRETTVTMHSGTASKGPFIHRTVVQMETVRQLSTVETRSSTKEPPRGVHK